MISLLRSQNRKRSKRQRNQKRNENSVINYLLNIYISFLNPFRYLSISHHCCLEKSKNQFKLKTNKILN